MSGSTESFEDCGYESENDNHRDRGDDEGGRIDNESFEDCNRDENEAHDRSGRDDGNKDTAASDSDKTVYADGYREWVSEINPDNYTRNCGSCALAVDSRLDGDKSAVAENKSYDVAEMEQMTGKEQKQMNYDEIKAYLEDKGPGSHGVVGVDRVNFSGHWFNAYNDSGKVIAIDGQTGNVSVWPPSFEPWSGVRSCDFSVEKVK